MSDSSSRPLPVPAATLFPQPEVIARTERWLVINKPAGWLTIPPSRPSADSTQNPEPVLSAWALQYEREQGGDKIWVVHRIDRETSGVVLFARTSEDHRAANGWFEKHQVRKVYDCLAVGEASMPVLTLRKPIQGAPSITQVEVMEAWREGFLARVAPRSGRRHQIRIHLADEGHPLWGDTRYGGPRTVQVGGQDLEVGRVALHAARLELPTGEKFVAPWPADFQSWVDRLGKVGTRV